MDFDKIRKMTVIELSEKLKNGEINSAEISKAYLERISKVDNETRAFKLVLGDKDILEKAESFSEVESKLAGIPFALQDDICTKGILTTCGSKMLESFRPAYGAFVAKKLDSSVLFGKLDMQEFAVGTASDKDVASDVRNPLNLKEKSKGTVSAVAAGEVPFAIGTDDGGETRIAAGKAGIVSMKPTYGAISRDGIISLSSSIGGATPVTKNVRDNAFVLNQVVGFDKNDAMSAAHEWEDMTTDTYKDISGMKIAVPTEFISEFALESEKDVFFKAVDKFKELGAEIVEIDSRIFEKGLYADFIIGSAEGSSNLGKFDGIHFGFRTKDYDNLDSLYKNTRKQGFGSEVKRRILIGNFVLSSENDNHNKFYIKAMKVRGAIKKVMKSIFEECDLVLMPTLARDKGVEAELLKPYMRERFTVLAGLGSFPVLAMSCGKDKEGNAVGMQLVGDLFSEAKIYNAGAVFEDEMKLKFELDPVLKGGSL